MYRVNDCVLYNFTVYNDDAHPDKVEGFFVIRQDLKWSEWQVSYEDPYSPGHGLGMEKAFPLSKYSYTDDWKPVPKKDYYCFKCSFKDASMLFTRDKKMDLIGEYYNFGYKNEPESFTFLYDEVKDFEHDEVDDLFSPAYSPQQKIYKNATTALTSLCDAGRSTVLPALVAVIIAAVLSLS